MTVKRHLHAATIQRAIRIVFFFALIVVAIYYLRGQWHDLRQNPPAIRWPVLVMAQIILTLGMAGLALANWHILYSLKSPLPLTKVLNIFFVSNLAKYLPGSIWALPGRAYLYQRAGLPTEISIAAVFWEVALMVSGAGLISLLSLRLLAQFTAFRLIASGFLLTLLLALLLAAINRAGWRAHLHLPGPAQRVLQNPENKLTWSESCWVLLIYMLSWVFIGLSFAAAVYAADSELGAIHGPELVGLYAGTWVAGFLAVFAPGGIGVRDVLITVGLGLLIDQPLPVVIAVIARIMWTVAELTGVLLSAILHTAVSRRSST